MFKALWLLIKRWANIALLKDIILEIIMKLKDGKIDKKEWEELMIYMLNKIKDILPGTLDDAIIDVIIRIIKGEKVNIK